MSCTNCTNYSNEEIAEMIQLSEDRDIIKCGINVLSWFLS